MASARLDRWLDAERPNFREGDAVKLLIASETPLGYKAIINHTHTGLLYRGELSGPLEIGQQCTGFVRTMRPDGKIGLGLDAAGYKRVAPLAERILEALKEKGGPLPYHDGSSPEEIREAFGVSKKAFKQALGALYRDKKIVIGEGEIAVAVPEKPRRRR
jgi:predicted RNA-binding protein (virulence factor B family)